MLKRKSALNKAVWSKPLTGYLTHLGQLAFRNLKLDRLFAARSSAHVTTCHWRVMTGQIIVVG